MRSTVKWFNSKYIHKFGSSDSSFHYVEKISYAGCRKYSEVKFYYEVIQKNQHIAFKLSDYYRNSRFISSRERYSRVGF